MTPTPTHHNNVTTSGQLRRMGNGNLHILGLDSGFKSTARALCHSDSLRNRRSFSKWF